MHSLQQTVPKQQRILHSKQTCTRHTQAPPSSAQPASSTALHLSGSKKLFCTSTNTLRTACNLDNVHAKRLRSCCHPSGKSDTVPVASSCQRDEATGAIQRMLQCVHVQWLHPTRTCACSAQHVNLCKRVQQVLNHCATHNASKIVRNAGEAQPLANPSSDNTNNGRQC
jgi:hypothetical protein